MARIVGAELRDGERDPADPRVARCRPAQPRADLGVHLGEIVLLAGIANGIEVLEVRDTDPQRAFDLANFIVARFVEDYRQERLSSREAAAFVSGVAKDAFSLWLNQHAAVRDLEIPGNVKVLDEEDTPLASVAILRGAIEEAAAEESEARAVEKELIEEDADNLAGRRIEMEEAAASRKAEEERIGAEAAERAADANIAEARRAVDERRSAVREDRAGARTRAAGRLSRRRSTDQRRWRSREKW